MLVRKRRGAPVRDSGSRGIVFRHWIRADLYGFRVHSLTKQQRKQTFSKKQLISFCTRNDSMFVPQTPTRIFGLFENISNFSILKLRPSRWLRVSERLPARIIVHTQVHVSLPDTGLRTASVETIEITQTFNCKLTGHFS